MEPSKSSNQLITRVISAIVALLALACAYFFFQESALKVVIALVPVLGSFELIRMIFRDQHPTINKVLFVSLVWLIFLTTALMPDVLPVVMGLTFIMIASTSLLISERFDDLSAVSFVQARSFSGVTYVGLLPGLVYQLLGGNNGTIWFAGLLAVVFAGDIGAFCFGILWGKRKILPLVSPKKTYIGSLGGIVGSVLASVALSHFMPGYPLWAFLLLGLVTAVFAQLGDFFESLLKRIANIKDSGKMMPGHGGILDRIDGVLFAAPVFLLGQTLFPYILVLTSY